MKYAELRWQMHEAKVAQKRAEDELAVYRSVAVHGPVYGGGL